MNERIKELAEQQGLTGPNFYISAQELEKFAELILTEVISTIYRSDISDKKQEKLVDELAYKFGMK